MSQAKMDSKYLPKKSGIYRIDCLANGKTYFGQSCNVKGGMRARAQEHIRKLDKNTHENKLLQNAWNRYGPKKFQITVELFCNQKDADFYEQKYLDMWAGNYKLSFNIAKKATAPGYGRKLTKATKKKMSLSHKGQKAWNKGITHSEKTKQKLSKIMKGKTWEEKYGQEKSDNLKQKARKIFSGEVNPMFGKKHTNKTKEKMSGENNHNYNATVYHFIHKTGIEEKCTQSELRKKYNIVSSSMSRIINNPKNSAKGWKLKGIIFSAERKQRKTNKGKKSSLGTRKKISNANKGINNKNYDHTIYIFKHKKYGIEECTRYELIKKYNLLDTSLSLVIKGKQNKHKGWRCVK